MNSDGEELEIKTGVAQDSEVNKDRHELLTLQRNRTPNLADVTAQFIAHPSRSYPKVLFFRAMKYPVPGQYYFHPCCRLGFLTMPVLC